MKQSIALNILKLGENVFITGSAGTGKTYLLNQYIEYLKARKVIPDTTLIPLLEKHNIAYGGINEQNLFTDMLFGWILPVFIFFGIWMLLANRVSKSFGNSVGGMLGMGGASKIDRKSVV